jgi:hypothetical protein
MTKKRDAGRKETRLQKEKSFSRRDFFKSGAAAGVSAAVLSGPGQASAQGIAWNYDVDVVVCGAGCTGLHAAIRARDLGASVLVVDSNFDVGGKMIHSGGFVSLGGGDAIQARDRAGADPDGLGLTAPLVPPADLEDDPDLLFKDMTDWSVMDASGVARYRYNDRQLHRAWADNAPLTRQFQLENYVRFARVDGTHFGGGVSRARMAKAMLKLAAKTDIKAGTLSAEDRGDPEKERHSRFNPMRQTPGIPAGSVGAPGWVYGGFCLARCLEFSAREKGVRFMLNRHMDEIVREGRFTGRVLGIRASYTPRFEPDTGARLESFWQNGNTDERAATIHIRARKAVIIGTGGHLNNRYVRTMFDPRLYMDAFEEAVVPLLGPHGQDASGIVAGMDIGANLAGMMQNYEHQLASPRISNVLATRDPHANIFPGHPSFAFAKAKGIDIGNSGWEHVIAVNQVGKRFYSETAIPNSAVGNPKYPPGTDGTRKPFTAADWRNASTAQIKAQYKRSSATDAALAINEGSQPPDFQSGPVWAIFDSAAATRTGWKIRYPYIADPPDGYFHKADTIAELARKVMENAHQKMPLKYLEQTVTRYNGFVDKGVDEDFEKPVMHKISTPPFYAAWAPIGMLDSFGGLRINGRAQVVDRWGEVIPGLYAGGEASGGGQQHGLGRASVHGYLAGTNAVREG